MRHPVAIVGAGASGICAAIELSRRGQPHLILLEKASDIGGTWRDNVYPGCLADVPVHAYSYSFALSSDWTHRYGRHHEILRYLRRVAERYDIMRKVVFNATVSSVVFDTASGCWRLETRDGRTYLASAVVMAVGALHVPESPDIQGANTFRGTMWHSAGWSTEYDPTGRRVAVIGTGASAAQLVPTIAPAVAQLYVYQRTPPWVVPRRDHRYRARHRAVFGIPGMRRLCRLYLYWKAEALFLLFRHHAHLMRIAELRSRLHLRRQVRDPQLRSRLTPTHTMGCKSIVLSSTYYPALARSNVELVTTPIAELVSTGVKTTDGAVRDVDDIIYATGFHVHASLRSISITGPHGVSLADAWNAGPEAFLGVFVAGFPNLFLMVGPNSGLGHASMMFIIEAQARLIGRLLRRVSNIDHPLLSVDRALQDRHNAKLQALLARSVWNSGGCRSWYLDERATNRVLWPRSAAAYILAARRTGLSTLRVSRCRPHLPP
jgi:cation diffusion facilitator CzcD-associated flavoprotein CzcO